MTHDIYLVKLGYSTEIVFNDYSEALDYVLHMTPKMIGRTSYTYKIVLREPNTDQYVIWGD